MTGMSRTLGTSIDGADHIAQSIGDILSTPLGTRTMRRDYGSNLFELMDQPINDALPLLVSAASALAIQAWETRVKLTNITLSGDLASGQAEIIITGLRTDLPAPAAALTLSIPFRKQ